LITTIAVMMMKVGIIQRMVSVYILHTSTIRDSRGLFGSSTKRDDTIVNIYDKDGEKKLWVVGKWSESLFEEVSMEKCQRSVLWVLISLRNTLVSPNLQLN
jgi:hypothetical protein